MSPETKLLLAVAAVGALVGALTTLAVITAWLGSAPERLDEPAPHVRQTRGEL
jgi:hypothetical protein